MADTSKIQWTDAGQGGRRVNASDARLLLGLMCVIPGAFGASVGPVETPEHAAAREDLLAAYTVTER